MKVRTKYADILNGSFKSLGYFIDRAIEASTVGDSLQIIAQNIVPLFRHSRALEPLNVDWVFRYNELRAEHEKQNNKCRAEVTQALKSLEGTLKETGLDEKDSIKALLQKKAESENRNVMESEWQRDERFVCNVCHELVRLGKAALVKPYAEVSTSQQYVFIECEEASPLQAYSCCECDYVYREVAAVADANAEQPIICSLDKSWRCPVCHDEKLFDISEFRVIRTVALGIIKDVVRIDQFIFARSKENFYKFVAKFFPVSPRAVTDAAIAFSHLSLILWCYETPQDYFEDKEDLKFSSTKSWALSLRYMGENLFWSEVNRLKNNAEAQSGHVFTRERITQWLTLIADEVIMYQETVSHLVTEDSAEPMPISMTLYMDGEYLLLRVQWSKLGKCKVYKIVQLTYFSGPYKFACEVVNAGDGQRIEVSENALGVSGFTVTKFFDRTPKLDPVLRAIFFKETGTNHVIVRSTTVDPKTISGINPLELCRGIRALEPFVTDLDRSRSQ